MKRALVCLAAFGAMTSIALADPPAEPTDTSVPSIVVGVTSTTVLDRLTDAEMDNIVAGEGVGFAVPDTAFTSNPNATVNAGQPGSQDFVNFVHGPPFNGLGNGDAPGRSNSGSQH